jgi:arylsulfatase A-like enzyme
MGMVAWGYAQPQPESIRNVLLIGWDGASRNHLKAMLDEGKLPNLDTLRKEGALCDTEVTTGATQTKPGWAEILTGYSAKKLKVHSNRNYHPIKKGFTVFERLKKHFGEDQIVTIFISGKENNVGARGPHEICRNCFSRDLKTNEKTVYWDKMRIKVVQTTDGKPPEWVKKEGEPYFYAKDSIDIFKNSLGPSEEVGQSCLDILNQYHQHRFFAFCHFEEPDELGHLYGESSQKYRQGFVSDDQWLGRIVQKLKELNIYQSTVIIVTADHGMDVNKNTHDKAPYTFAVINKIKRLRDGDRKDIAPTIYELLGVDGVLLDPPLAGRSLILP